MPPSKRGTSSGATPQSKKGRRGSSTAGSPGKCCAPAYVEKVLDDFSTLIAGKTTISEWLDEQYPDSAACAAFYEALGDTFPKDKGVKYCQALTPGAHALRPWHLSWKKCLGTVGYVEEDQQLTLLQLILKNGFQTDVDRFPGTEKLTCNEPNPATLDDGYDGAMIDESLVRGGMVAFTKGWRRAVTELFVLSRLLYHELAQTMLDNRPGIFSTHQTIHIVVPVLDSPTNNIRINRGPSNVHVAVLSEVRGI